MINIGIIGVGYWGKNLIRNFKELRDVRIEYLCDINTDLFKSIDTKGIKTIKDYKKILEDKSVNAVVIATNIPTHYKLVRESLLANKNVFVEKPLSVKQKEVEELIDLARRKNLVLFVDYLLLYSPAVKKIKEIIEKDSLGKIYSIKNNRLSPPRGKEEINVVIDLLPHDLSILYYLLNAFPKEVLSVNLKSYAIILFKYNSGIIANVNLSRVNYEKERRHYLYGTKGMIIWDEVKSNNIKLIDNSYKPKILKTDSGQPLIKVCEDFIERCKNKNYVDHKLSVKVAEIYDAIKKSEKEKRWINI